MKKKKEIFKHNPDGYIHINDWICELEDFVKENPEYKLPEGFVGREYVKGKMHRVYTETTEKFLGEEWENGDRYLQQAESIKKKILSIDEKEIERTEKRDIEENREILVEIIEDGEIKIKKMGELE
jgi:hypothetical protein